MSTAESSALPAPWDRAQQTALRVGIGGAGLSVLLALISFRGFLQAYLVAYTFWFGITLGSLGVLMLHYLVGGAWGFLIRRPLEAATKILPMMTALFIPILLGLGLIYPWAQPDKVAASEALRHKSLYLNTTGFLIRAAVYFLLWNGLAFFLNRGSQAQDRTEDPSPTWRSQTISAPGLVFTFLATSFAVIDWLMSLEPEWYSTIYGAMLIVGMALSAFAAMIIVAALLADTAPLNRLAKAEAFGDLGNLMLAFVMLWAYMSFSQYLIIWSGNLREEIPWYLRRSVGIWWVTGAILIFIHFFLPFICLLFRETKRDARNVWKVALLILVMHVVNDIWLIMPALPGSKLWPAIGFLPAFVGIGGLWISAFVGFLKRRPLVPLHDPLLAEVLEHEGGH